MLLMFGIFAVLFYRDGSTGYRNKNLSYYTWKSFDSAASTFSNKMESMDPEAWREYASNQQIKLPDDRSILPADTPESIPWPEILRDYEAMEKGLTNPKKLLFDVYRDQAGMTYAAPEQPLSARKIFEQWVVFWICLVLFLITLLFLLRTLTRKVALEGDTLYPASGKPLRIADLVRLDLRLWDRKGLAFAWASQENGQERKIRIDGLTYGGFKHEHGQPAEKLMQALKAKFSGELIEYVEEDDSPDDTNDASSSTDDSRPAPPESKV